MFIIFIALAVLVIICLQFFDSTPERCEPFQRQEATRRTSGIPRTQAQSIRPYDAQPVFLTLAERSFFGVLLQAVRTDYHIFCKVRLADVITPCRELPRRHWQAGFNQISSKHLDFILCDPATLKVVAVIELDDRSHAAVKSRSRDAFVDSAVFSAGIRIVRIEASSGYSPVQVREQITSILSPKGIPFKSEQRAEAFAA